VAQCTEVIDAFPSRYDAALRRGQRLKLGLLHHDDDFLAADAALADDWLALLQAQRADFTLAWRRLAEAAAGDEAPLQALFADADAPTAWLSRWRARLAAEARPAEAVAAQLRAANPWVIPRNHRVEQALSAASDEGDRAPFEQLLAALRQPFDELPRHAAYAEPAPPELTACYRTFCGT
jgi:uncharacterized protein YdiU (UPF0061 family)